MAGVHPLLQPWTGPLALPDFESIEATTFESAFEIAMASHIAEIEAISNNPEAPTFANTVAAFDQAGADFDRLSRLFQNLCYAETTESLQRAERIMAPKIAAHGSRVSLHEGIFARLDFLHENKASLGLDPVQNRLLERFHIDFVRGGAKLIGQDRTRAAEIAQQLATLHTSFSQNILTDESSWYIELKSDQDLAGLPEWLRSAANGAALSLGLPARSHVITLSRSLVTAFLANSTHRELREVVWKAWIRRGENDTAADNRPLITQILALRLELATLHGYTTFTEFQLSDTMAQTSAAVDTLLQRVWAPARSAAIAEYEELNAIARAAGEPNVEGWDWRYFAEKIRSTKYHLNDDAVKQYFSLDAVLGAAFDCAERLFGLQFVEHPNIVSYHHDVRTFQVLDRHNEPCGVFISDNYARPSKRSGAWMSTYRLRCIGTDAALPVIANHNNFAKGSGSPTLLSLDEARTLFHEFGHGLHGLLSESPYKRLAGTAVLRDFVELPSQLFEHWILEPEVLRRHARHYETGAPIPDEMIELIQRSNHFNQGFETVEYISCALVDLALHQQTDLEALDLVEFERSTLADIGMPQSMVMRHRLTHFSHLFSSQYYASSYYVYMWAEVLDADAFNAFTEANDPFDPATATRLHRYIYSSGNTIEPGEAYRAFRGRDAGVEPLLRGRGLITT
jgi:peptidyl-dipeptidase Dcp